MIYVTSDWHFSHDKEFIWKSRGYSSIEDMNEGLIQKYNSLIHMDDEIYVLGDCCLGGPNSLVKNKNLIERLNGKLHIAFGNHCTIQRQEMYKSCQNVVETGYAYAFTYRKYHFYASHYPTLCSNYDDGKTLRAKTLNLCGHTHATDPFADWNKGCIYHCEVDAHECYPVLLDDIIEEMKTKVEECKAQL